MSGAANDRARAWKEWEDAIRVATDKLCSSGQLNRAESKGSFVGFAEPDSYLPEIAYWLADQVMIARGFQEPCLEYRFDDRQLSAMRSIVGRTRSEVYADPIAAIWLGARIVEDLAAALLKRELPEVPDDEVARGLIDILVLKVHPNFCVLQGKQPEVLALLRRYEPDRSRRRTKSGEPSKLSANGILSLLNELSGRPLGEGGELTANAIASAIDRAKARGIPPAHLVW